MRRKPVIALDVDGVSANFIGSVLPVVRRVLGRPWLTEASVTSFQIEEALGMTDSEYDEYNRAVCAKGFCANIEPYPGAIEGVAALQQFADVYAVTSPYDSDYWHREREQWCERVLGISRERVCFLRDKFLFDADALVDDRTPTLEDWYSVGRIQMPVLFLRPWNVVDDWSHNRVVNWSELVALLTRRFA